MWCNVVMAKVDGDHTAEINGRVYNLWPQFVAQKGKWIGGTLQDLDRDCFRMTGGYPPPTEITGIQFGPNGEDGAMFSVEGKDYTCACDVSIGLGITPGEKGWITFYGPYGIGFRIKERE